MFHEAPLDQEPACSDPPYSRTRCRIPPSRARSIRRRWSRLCVGHLDVKRLRQVGDADRGVMVRCLSLVVDDLGCGGFIDSERMQAIRPSEACICSLARVEFGGDWL